MARRSATDKRAQGLARLEQAAKRAPTKTQAARLRAAHAYIEAHPKQSFGHALANAKRVWRSHGLHEYRSGIAKDAAAARSGYYYRFAKNLVQHGFPQAAAKEFSARLFTLNHAFYNKRDNPPIIWDSVAEDYRPMDPARIRSEYFDDFYDFYDDLADYGDFDYDLHEAYAQEI